MARKYLDELSNIERWDNIPTTREERERQHNERKIYGFDSREIVRMDVSFLNWLYERVSMFQAVTSHRDDLHHVKLEYNGQIYSQAALISLLLKRCKHCMAAVETKRLHSAYYNDLNECLCLWSVLMPAMWLE